MTQDRGRYRDRRQGNLIGLSWFGASPARMKGCWRQKRASSPRAGARPFGLRGLTPFASLLGPWRALGLIARTRLLANEVELIARLIRSKLEMPFNFLLPEFEQAA